MDTKFQRSLPDVAFIGMGSRHDGSEVQKRTGGPLDLRYAARLARTHEEGGWDGILFAYGAGSADPMVLANWIGTQTQNLRLVVAMRPNTISPTAAASAVATLDHVTGGRTLVHIIAGGSDQDQIREGDWLPKDARYRRASQWIQILKGAWSSDRPFDHDGADYKIQDFKADIRPLQLPHPHISVGGASDAAIRLAAEEADIYAMWGEPLPDMAQQIAGLGNQLPTHRTMPVLQAGFRPIVAKSDSAAWDRARDILSRIKAAREDAGLVRRHDLSRPHNTGSQRLLEIGRNSRSDESPVWMAPAVASGAPGSSTALVGSASTVASLILEYYDLGIRIFVLRGYETLEDAQLLAEEVLPMVRAEVVARKVKSEQGGCEGVPRDKSPLRQTVGEG